MELELDGLKVWRIRRSKTSGGFVAYCRESGVGYWIKDLESGGSDGPYSDAGVAMGKFWNMTKSDEEEVA